MSYKHLYSEERHYIEIELKKGASNNEVTLSDGVFNTRKHLL